MSRPFLVAVFAVPAVALAYGGQLPTPEQHALAKELKTTIDGLVPRTKELASRLAKAEEALAAAGVRFDRARSWETFKQERVPSRQDIAPLEIELAALEADAKKLDADCDAFAARKLGLKLEYGVEKEEADCVRWFDSMHEKADCTPWRKLAIAFWPEKTQCDSTSGTVLSSLRGYARWHADWAKEVEKEEGASAQDALLTTPVAGGPGQRAIPIPRKYKKAGEFDALGLFNDAHPSHFVFLRKDAKGVGSLANGEDNFMFFRTLKKGEAVLATLDRSTGERELSVLGLDGARATVSVEEVSVSPLPGSKLTVLTAADLFVRNAEGRVIAGPPWLQPDTTGFKLGAANAWMDLLDPPEPRQQKFIDAKEKVVTCYRKQMERLDPSGRFRKNYDVVTYGRGGVEKIESAADNFDRKACGACGCKAFDDLKRKLVGEAIGPSQKQAFEAYKPVIEKLSKTDFAAAAAKGAAPGPLQKANEPY